LLAKRNFSFDRFFEGYSRFVVKHRRAIVVIWIAAIILSLPFAIESNSIVSYSINVPTSNNESRIAENMISTEFPHYQQPNTTYYIVIQGGDVLTPQYYQNYKQLNYTLFKDLSSYKIKGVDSIYSFESSLLNNVFSNLTDSVNSTILFMNSTSNAISQVTENLSSANSKEYMIYQNAVKAVEQVENLSTQINQTNYYIYQLQNRINQTSYMIYAVPQGFAETWLAIYSSPQGSYMTTHQLNLAANSTFVNASQISKSTYPTPLYYSLYFDSWSKISGTLPAVYVRSNMMQLTYEAINMTVPNLVSYFNQSEGSFIQYVWNSFNLTNYYNVTLLSSATLNFALKGLSSEQANIVRTAYALGSNPPYSSIEATALSLLTGNLPPSQAEFVTSAFNASKNSSLGNFTIQYFMNQVINSYPLLSSQIEKSYNITLDEFLTLAFNAGYPPEQNALDNSSILLVSRAIESNHSIANLLMNRYNESAASFVSFVFNASKLNLMKEGAITLVSKAVAYQVSKIYYLEYNITAIEDVARSLYYDKASGNVADQLLSTLPLNQMPVFPDKGFLSQFVSQSSNTTIAVVTFNSSIDLSGQKEFENIVSSFNSTSFKTHYTATEILNNDVKQIISESEKVALPFGLVIALLVAGIFFLSPVSAFLPLIMFGVSIEVGFGIVDLFLGHIQGEKLSYISPIIISVLGLGLASDYVVLLMNRFKQELKSDRFEAARITSRWAGEAVFTSALTVIMSYLALSLSGIPLFSDVGSANVIVVTVILLASLTFLPALLSTMGEKVFWPRKVLISKPTRLSSITKRSIRHPKTVVSILVIVTIISVVFAVSLPVNIDFLSLAPNTPAKQGLDQITANFGGSLLLPEYAVIQLPSPISYGNNTFNTTELLMLSSIESNVRAQQGVTSVFSIISPFNETIEYQKINSLDGLQRSVIAESMLSYLSSDNKTTYMKIVFQGNPFGDTVLNEANKMQHALSGSYASGYKILVGGISTDSYGVLQYVFQVLPKIILVLIAAIFVVLFLQLKSIFTPLRLIATILSSVAWTLSLVWLIFYRFSGLSIYIFAPLFLVTTMLGVGMDYDIFLITRVREEVMKGKEDDEALIITSETTAGVIIALGLILGSVFFGLVLTQVKLLQQIGLTLTLGVLLDTFVVWLMFVPAIMVLARRLNWWPGNPRNSRNN